MVLEINYVNGNAPRFSAEEYSVTLPEDADLGTLVAKVRETISKYSLEAVARDRERDEWGCSSELVVKIDDVNDNAPRFSAEEYSVTLPEDADLGTLVAKVHATDADLGENRLVRYSWVEDNINGAFELSPDSGIITLRAALDREAQAEHKLIIRAKDSGRPQRSATATVRLSVADVNDNPPEFEFRAYRATVPELDAVGTEILRVHATSRDTGVNADVYYSLVGGDDRDDFAVDRGTGALSIARPLDYERRKEYFLTIQAIDGGAPPLSDLATVNITIEDSNDNAPVFTQASYGARVREDATSGTRILQVIADDADAGLNGRVTYSIARGDVDTKFAIDPDTGYVSVVRPLDRETTPAYVLEVRARDRGIPSLEATALVNIEVVDANDNPPLFSQSNYTAVVREDRPLGHTILKFEVDDADAPPNAAPYTFDFQSGNEMGAFRLEPDGYLRSATRFNHRIRDRYVLQIRVFDNGTPPLFSDAWVHIRVVEESQYPPVVTPLEVTVNSYLDEFPGGVVGRVFASDRDAYDTLSYALVPVAGAPYAPTDLFEIDATDGTLRAAPRLDVGDYRLNVTVDDGKFTGFAIIRVSVVLISDEILQQAIVVRFRAVTDRDFVLSHRKGFLRSVAEATECEPGDVIIIGVQPSEVAATLEDDVAARRKRQVAQDLDVAFAVRSGGGLLPAEALRRRLNAHVERLEERARLVVEELMRATCGGCTHGTCSERVVLRPERLEERARLVVEELMRATCGGCTHGTCSERVVLRPGARVVATDVFALVAPPHKLKGVCACAAGFAGERCDLPLTDCKPAPDGMYCYLICLLVVTKQPIKLKGGQGIHNTEQHSPWNMGRGARVVATDVFALVAPPHKLKGVCACAAGFAGERCDLPLTDCKPAPDGVYCYLICLLVVTKQPIKLKGGQGIHNTEQHSPWNMGRGARVVATDVFALVAPPHKLKGVCACAAGFAGERCDLPLTDCKPAPDVVATDVFALVAPPHKLKGVCACAAGFAGERCDLPLTDCKPAPDVAPPHKLKGVCACAAGFAGERCDLPLTDCKPAPDGVYCYLICLLVVTKQPIKLKGGQGIHNTEQHSPWNMGRGARVVATDVFALVAPPHKLKGVCACAAGFAGERCDLPFTDCKPAPDGTESACCDGPECRTPGIVQLSGDGYLVYRVERGVVDGARLLDDEINLSLRFRTRRTRGTLLHAAGRVDFAQLHLIEGQVEFRMELGSGEVRVRAGENVADGAWHTVRLDRRGAGVRLTVDRRVASKEGPPPAALLDARPDRVLIGAALYRHAHPNAPEQVTYGFHGCITDLKLSGVGLPLEEGGTSTDGRAQLIRRVRARVGSTCAPLPPPGACGSYPCQNGGTCKELPLPALLEGEEGYSCICHARFLGRHCEIDSDPCASAPCLHGGVCSNDNAGGYKCSCAAGLCPAVGQSRLIIVFLLTDNAGGYKCSCAAGLAGVRCERGRWCAAGVCAHGGACEEGEWGPSCRCRGDIYRRPTKSVFNTEYLKLGFVGSYNDNAGGYKCSCAAGLAGVRCERGRWCAAGVCAHGGACEEGEWGPSCRCRG
ncbi:cadherin domain-containing protein [Phthorimaea operculella]|nr:cadherin domain-containing protein [Phthorimaea operculella]